MHPQLLYKSQIFFFRTQTKGPINDESSIPYLGFKTTDYGTDIFLQGSGRASVSTQLGFDPMNNFK